MAPEAFTIRRGEASDLQHMAELERQLSDSPWSLSQFLNGSLSEEQFSLVAEDAREQLAGFAIFQRVLDEGSLLNIAVAPELQGRGLGGRLLAAGLEQLRGDGATRCLLEVRVGNLPAIALYRGRGFVDDGVRKDYYPSPTGREHALLMSLNLDRD